MLLYQQHLLFYLPYVSIALTGILLLLRFVPRQQYYDEENSNNNVTTTTTTTDQGGGGGTINAIVSQIVGYTNILLLCLYLSKVLGNHYVKVYAITLNLIALLVLPWLSNEDDGGGGNAGASSSSVIIILIAFLIPTILYLVITITIPSVSVIVPEEQLLLGNCAAATSPDIIKRYKITHVLELHDGRKYNNDPKVVTRILNNSNNNTSNNIGGGGGGSPQKKKQLQHQLLLQLKCSDDLGSKDSLLEISEEALNFIDSAIASTTGGGGRGVILVHCSAGVSRSAALVVLWLVARNGGGCGGRTSTISIDEAYAMVRKARPIVDINTDHIVAIRNHPFFNNKRQQQQR